VALSHRSNASHAVASSAPASSQTVAVSSASAPTAMASASAAPVASADSSAAPIASATAPTEVSALLASTTVEDPSWNGGDLVKSPPEGKVYVNGLRGRHGQGRDGAVWSSVLAGGDEIGAMGLKAVSWLSEGQSAVIHAQGDGNRRNAGHPNSEYSEKTTERQVASLVDRSFLTLGTGQERRISAIRAPRESSAPVGG